MSEWQDISTAPRDGTKFDAWCASPKGGPSVRFPNVQMRGDGSGFGFAFHTPAGVMWSYLEDDESIYPAWTPTHWMPLPAPPALSASDKTGE